MFFPGPVTFPDPESGAGRLWRALMKGPEVIFAGLSRCREAFYRRGWVETVRVPVPVFCVGNLTVGGSGKTPGVVWLVNELKRRGHGPAVVSRGYGRRAQGTFLVPNQGETLPSVEDIGDEPRLLARATGVPLSVGSDRALACERVWEAHRPDCVVMDDGFQHFRLHRDRNFLCWDALSAHAVMVGGAPTPLLPAGPWREPPSAARRADLVFLTRSERVSEEESAHVKKAMADKGIRAVAVRGRLACFDPSRDGGEGRFSLAGAKVLALSGLGDPRSFEDSLRRVGAEVEGLRYGDHHVFSSSERSEALRRARREGRRVVVTEKDRERLPDDFPALVARLEWEVEDDTTWGPVIESVFS